MSAHVATANHGPVFLAAVNAYTVAFYDCEVEAARDELAFRYWRRSYLQADVGSAFGAHACSLAILRYRDDTASRARAALSRATRVLEAACAAPQV